MEKNYRFYLKEGKNEFLAMFFFLFLYLLVELFFECVVGKIRGHKKRTSACTIPL